MPYIIIKTNKNLQSELVSVHNNKEEASYNLNNLSDNKFINKIIDNSILKVCENNYIFKNNTLHLYQIIQFDNKNINYNNKFNNKLNNKNNLKKI